MFKKQNAFTLIELMVTLVVLGIVLSVALPSFKSQILNNKAAVLSDNFVTALNFVRTEAVKQGAPQKSGSTARFVTLCPSINGTACSTNPDDWSKTIMAVVDLATSADATAVVNPTILKVWTRTDEKAWVTVKNADEGNTAVVRFIRYTSSGKLAMPSANFQGFTIQTKMKDKDQDEQGQNANCIKNSARIIKINIFGQTNASKFDCW